MIETIENYLSYNGEKNPPKNNPEKLWELQNVLLKDAELKLGNKAKEVIICQPCFDSELSQPQIFYYGNGIGARLTERASCDWQLTVFQLAHETIHLLKSRDYRDSNFLEEGIAVLFSLYACQNQINVSLEKYERALSLVNNFNNPYEAAKKIRQKYVELSEVKQDELLSMFPSMDIEIAKILCTKF